MLAGAIREISNIALVGFRVHVIVSLSASVTVSVCSKVLVLASSIRLVESGKFCITGGYKIINKQYRNPGDRSFIF